MQGKLLGRLAVRGWRDGWRADRRWARQRDERLWARDATHELADLAEEREERCVYGCCPAPHWDNPWPYD